MAWAERSTFDTTIHKVEEAPREDESKKNREEEVRLREIFRDMPPYIKITSGRARKTLARYEALKQRRIEKLRENCVFKFVMMVAGLTNERMEKYWKGDSVSPFSDTQMPMATQLDKKDLKLLRERARERAFADLHQFCTPQKAVPMYRNAVVNNPLMSVAPPPSPLRRSASDPIDTGLGGGIGGGIGGDIGGEYKNEASAFSESEKDISSRVKYIYNMGDSEFEYFINRFKQKKFFEQDATKDEFIEPEKNIGWYVLGRRLAENGTEDELPAFPAHKHFKGQDARPRTYGADGLQPWYIDVTGTGEIPMSQPRLFRGGPPIYENRPQNHSRDRIYDQGRVFGQYGQTDSYDHPDEYLTLKRSNWWQWAQNVPIVRWEADRPEFWFQRYIARWLTRDSNVSSSNNDQSVDAFTSKRTLPDSFLDLTLFKNRFQGVFNNLTYHNGAWVRDLTGLRLTKMLRKGDDVDVADGGIQTEEWEGQNDTRMPCEPACEVPLDFVRPLFNERYSFWKHELVIGEYEKRVMYQADQWLQKTPWAIGKIYLQPSIYAHMQEAHVAVSSKYKKFRDLELRDWISSEDHRYFFSKLVSLCIRTTAVLSNKKYGLDKAYMRLNLEKRRIMHAIGKLKSPQKVRTTGSATASAVAFPRATPMQADAWDRYAAARRENNTTAAANALRDMN